MSSKIRILIAEDHKVVADGLVTLIREDTTLEYVGCVANGQELVDRLQEKNDDVDLILMDIRMPVMNGFDATSSVKSINPAIKILIMTGFDEQKYLIESLRRKADGFISKNNGKNDFLYAIHQVYSGRQKFVAIQDNDDPEDPEKQGIEIPDLTPTEKRILCCIVQKEMTSSEIGEEIRMNVPSVEKHRRNIMSKLGVKSVAGMVRVAVEFNLCD